MLKKNEEITLEIQIAAFEEPEACKCNTHSVFLFNIQEYHAKTR